MSTMNFSHLRLLCIFSVVVDEGSFAGAARKLKSSRSRISEQISQLESDLKVRLLQRSTRQLGLTQEGMKVYDKARMLPGLLKEIGSITEVESLSSGKVTLTLSQDSAHKLFLPKLKEFQQAFPEIELDLILEDKQMDLIENQIDLAIRIGEFNDEMLIARLLHKESACFYANPSYLEKHGYPEDIEDLSNHTWITYMDSRLEIKIHGVDSDIVFRPKKIIRCNSPMMAQSLAANGFGVSAFLPCIIKTELSTDQLVQVLPALHSKPLGFYLVYLSRHNIPRRVQVLIDFILSAGIFK